jgi:hypothetical protein
MEPATPTGRLQQLLNRVKSSSIWSGNIKDISLWGLSGRCQGESMENLVTPITSRSAPITFRGLLTGFQYHDDNLPAIPAAGVFRHAHATRRQVLIDQVGGKTWHRQYRNMRTAGHPSTFSGTPTRALERHGSVKRLGSLQGPGLHHLQYQSASSGHANRLKSVELTSTSKPQPTSYWSAFLY